MDTRDSHGFPHWRLARILGGALLVLCGSIYFSGVSAKTEQVDKFDGLNLVNGRLAFVTTRAGMSTFEQSITTMNADGSGRVALPRTAGWNHRSPTWSPDGTKMLIVTSPPPDAPDIWIVNPDGTGLTNLTNSPNLEDNPSWSVTGKIAYESGNQIWTMNPDGSGQTHFAAITQPSPRTPVWSPDGSKLAFASADRIWIINADGTNQHRLTTNTVGEGVPTWSPDGSKIAFGKISAGIAVVNAADGSNEVPLSGNSSDRQPAWSPDGTKIAFVRGAGLRGLYTMDSDGANQVLLAPDTINFPLPCCDSTQSDPAWQPVAGAPNSFSIGGRVMHGMIPVVGATVNLSGTAVGSMTTDATGNYSMSGLPAGGNYTVSISALRHYFTPANRSFTNLTSDKTANFDVLAVCQWGRCVRNGKLVFVRAGEIYSLNADGTGETNITNNGATDTNPDWAPDGVNLVFTTNRDGNFEIYRKNQEDDPFPSRLTNNAASDTWPHYSPDGTSIVFISDRDGNNEIYRMNADGTNQVRLTNTAAAEVGPTFSGDGKKIVHTTFEQNLKSIMTMNADGSNQQLVPGSQVTIGIYENRVYYHPSGSKLIFTFAQDASSNFRVTWTSNADGSGRAQFPQDGRDGTYSPDGERVAYSCCQFNNTNRIIRSTDEGTSPQPLTGTSGGNGNFAPEWQGFAVKRATFDFDGDGRSDPAIFRASAGDWWYLASSDGSQRASHWGESSDVITPADYDGDLKTDFAVWRPSDGNFYIVNSSNATVRVENFGVNGDIPTGGDFDGDNKADLAVYRAGSQSTFYYRGSMGNGQGNITFIPWGMTGDKPVLGDYDGDGQTDAAIYRPSNGTWYIRQSSNGQLLAAGFGISTDKIVPADYDGDGRTDLAVYRDGVWYLYQWTEGFLAFQFGIAGDIPTPADYSGDGRAEAAIFRDGVWWTFNLQSGAAQTVQFGVATDSPAQAAFVR